MAEQTREQQISHRWYTRPVLFVADVTRALRFYEGLLGFEKAWHEGDGEGKVCQVNRAECEIIVSEWHSPGHPDRIVDCSFYLYRHSPSFHFKLYLGEDFVLGSLVDLLTFM